MSCEKSPLDHKIETPSLASEPLWHKTSWTATVKVSDLGFLCATEETASAPCPRSIRGSGWVEYVLHYIVDKKKYIYI